jgi:hypothetical protein
MSKKRKANFEGFQQREVVEAMGNLLLVLIIVFAYAAIQLLRGAPSHSSYMFILVSSLLAGLAAIIYLLEDMMSTATPRTAWSVVWWAMLDLIGLLCMTAVYLFGCYMFFYEGLWALKNLGVNGINPMVLIIKVVFSLCIGYGVLYFETKALNLLKNFSRAQK